MIKNTDNIYKSATIRLDGNSFENCAFDKCRLVFGGTGDVGISGCTFKECEWTFIDSAATTLRFLSGLYSGFGPDGKQLVEDTFKNIRSGNV